MEGSKTDVAHVKEHTILLRLIIYPCPFLPVPLFILSLFVIFHVIALLSSEMSHPGYKSLFSGEMMVT